MVPCIGSLIIYIVQKYHITRNKNIFKNTTLLEQLQIQSQIIETEIKQICEDLDDI